MYLKKMWLGYIILAVIIFWPIFSSFFFMDDFFFLQISQVNPLKGCINLFQPIKFIPYRPISQQLFFFSFYRIFGFNPLPFHIFIFFIHLVNAYLVSKIVKRLISNSAKAQLISLIYLASPIHFVGLYSLTGSYIIIGTLFFLLSLLCWLQFEGKTVWHYYLLSLLTFILGLFSAEIAASLPFIILLVSKLTNKIKLILPYLGVIALNLVINHFFAGTPPNADFNLELVAFPKLFRWYLLRALGLPEGLRNGYILEQIIIVLFFIVNLFIITMSIFINKNLIIKKRVLIIKNIIWIIIASLPFYFMPNHLNPMYFCVSLIGLLFLLATIINQKQLLFFTAIYILLALVSVNLLQHTHWTVRRSNLTRAWINKVKKINPDKDLIILEIPDNNTKDELEITLQQNRALQLFFNQPGLKTIYKIKENDAI